MKLHAKRGRNQQGLCFVSTDAVDPPAATCELKCDSNSIYSDLRGSAKVPDGIVILDARVYDMLHCSDEDEISITLLSDKIPTCTEINLDIISKRDLQTHTVAQAISQRIDDFQEHFEGLILQTGQEFAISDLGITFVVRSMSPTDSVTNAARITWKNLLKIHLGAIESQPTNLCIIVEVAAATQITDVQMREDDPGLGHREVVEAALLPVLDQEVLRAGKLWISHKDAAGLVLIEACHSVRVVGC